jgi:hypothetical protein
MDATRPRRLRDSARQGWYARWRSFRFARHLGFPLPPPSPRGRRPCPGRVPPRGLVLDGPSPRWSPAVLDRQNRQACLGLAGQHVPPSYGPSGDVTWDEADPTYSPEAARRGG